MTAYDGRCHCGAIGYRFTATRPIEALGLRGCLCTFCRAHGARNVADPDGTFELRVRDPEAVQRYRFGLGTADFILCRTCGCYVAAVLSEGERAWATINVNTLIPPPPLDWPLAPMDYDAENTAGRVERRTARWTPVVA